MSKVGQAFGQGGKKPSTLSIFLSLASAARKKGSAADTLAPGVSSLKKFTRERQEKATRLGSGGTVGGAVGDEEDLIKRPGVRKAKLLGS